MTRRSLDAIGWARLAVAVVGTALIAYGAVLAWRAEAATAVLVVGAAFVVVALVLPHDWTKLALGLPGGARLEFERAQAAQETLAKLPRAAQQELAQTQLPAAAAPAGPAPSERLTEDLLSREAFASHETGTGWSRLMLKRRATAVPTEPVTCVVRKPGGGHLVGVPRVVEWTEPPTLFGSVSTFKAPGTWLLYEAVFPDFFVEAGTDLDAELPAGDYVLSWSTSSDPPRVLASDSFAWPTRG